MTRRKLLTFFLAAPTGQTQIKGLTGLTTIPAPIDNPVLPTVPSPWPTPPTPRGTLRCSNGHYIPADPQNPLYFHIADPDGTLRSTTVMLYVCPVCGVVSNG